MRNGIWSEATSVDKNETDVRRYFTSNPNPHPLNLDASVVRFKKSRTHEVTIFTSQQNHRQK